MVSIVGQHSLSFPRKLMDNPGANDKNTAIHIMITVSGQLMMKNIGCKTDVLLRILIENG